MSLPENNTVTTVTGPDGNKMVVNVLQIPDIHPENNPDINNVKSEEVACTSGVVNLKEENSTSDSSESYQVIEVDIKDPPDDEEDADSEEDIMKPFFCQLCLPINKAFSSREKLELHQYKHQKPPYQCTKCHKSFEKVCQLGRHIRSHSGEKPFICIICGRTFSQVCNMKKHMLTHSKLKPFRCGECNKTFHTADRLEAHRRTHTGEKPFVCNVCGKSFGHASNLSIHKRTHTGQRPYHCLLCAKSFTQVGSLSRHLLTHTGQKPYQCGVCGKSFTQSNNTKKHILTHIDAASTSRDITDALVQPTSNPDVTIHQVGQVTSIAGQVYHMTDQSDGTSDQVYRVTSDNLEVVEVLVADEHQVSQTNHQYSENQD